LTGSVGTIPRKQTVSIPFTVIRPTRLKAEFSGIRIGDITREEAVFAAKCIRRRIEFLDLRYLRARTGRDNHALPYQYSTDNEADDDQHNGKLNEREAVFRIAAPDILEITSFHDITVALTDEKNINGDSLKRLLWKCSCHAACIATSPAIADGNPVNQIRGDILLILPLS
jgi:hypothetical protein